MDNREVVRAGTDALIGAGPPAEASAAADGPRFSRFDPRRIVFPASLYPLFILFGLNAVDELDRSAFSVLLPEIRDHFGLNVQGILTLAALVGLTGILIGPFVGFLADRRNRVKIASFGAVVWGVFSVMTGLAGSLFLLGLARAGSGLGKTVNQPTHNSLLADFYPPQVRARVYYAHAGANPVGQFIAPLTAGFIAVYFSWRVPFVVLSIPTFIFVLLALRLREPKRGALDFAGVSPAAEAKPLGWRDGVRELWRVRSYRRVCYSLPFLAISAIGLQGILSLFWADVYGLDPRGRGFIQSFDEPFSVAGLIVAGAITQRLINKNPSLGAYFTAAVGLATATLLAIQAFSPSIGGLPVAIGASWLRGFFNSMIIPGLFALGSYVLPANVRSLGYAASSLWLLPGVAVGPIVGAIADRVGLQIGVIAIIPVYLFGAFLLSTGAKFVERDMARAKSLVAAETI